MAIELLQYFYYCYIYLTSKNSKKRNLMSVKFKLTCLRVQYFFFCVVWENNLFHDRLNGSRAEDPSFQTLGRQTVWVTCSQDQLLPRSVWQMDAFNYRQKLNLLNGRKPTSTDVQSGHRQKPLLKQSEVVFRHTVNKSRRPAILHLNIEGLTASKMSVLHHLATASGSCHPPIENPCTAAKKLVIRTNILLSFP